MRRDIDGYIGENLTYCSECGLESEECRCDGVVVEEILGEDDDAEDD